MFDFEIARVRSIPMTLQRGPHGSVIHLDHPRVWLCAPGPKVPRCARVGWLREKGANRGDGWRPNNGGTGGAHTEVAAGGNRRRSDDNREKCHSR
jgi:hypothetical protein